MSTRPVNLQWSEWSGVSWCCTGHFQLVTYIVVLWIFSMSFHSCITSPSKRKSDDLLSYFKTYDFKKEHLFSFGYLLVLLIFFSPHVYAKFDSFKSVAVDSIFAVPVPYQMQINWNTEIRCWQLLQLSIIMLKKALELVIILKLLHEPYTLILLKRGHLIFNCSNW